MFWTHKRVLVTGAGGFIGSHLVEALLDLGANVTAMIRYNSRNDWGNLEFLPPEKKSELNVVAGNIEDGDFIAKQIKNTDIVFHLAALIGIPYSYEAPISYARTNVLGTINILEAARRYEVQKVVHTSTSEVYGTAMYVPIDERHPLQAQSPYSASKIAADKIAESYYLSFNLPVATIRPFNTYGPRQSARAIIPTIVGQALMSNEILLGSLSPVRDLNFVKDTVLGFIKIAENPNTSGKVINIGSGKGISIGDLASMILELMGCDKPIITDEKRIRPEKSEVYQLVCDSSRAKKLTGWEPTSSLIDGLSITIDFISEHRSLFKPDIYNV